MDVDRRAFVAVAGALTAACDRDVSRFGQLSSGDAWDGVRAQFALSPDIIDMSAMLLSSHPRRVRDAIERHRRELDRDTVGYLHANNDRLNDAAREAAGAYLGVPARQIALTDSTTMGVGLIYGGLMLRPGDEILTTDQDYFVTHESIRLACARTGAIERRVSLHEGNAASVTEDEIGERVGMGITPATRIVGLTWVHSSTGLKIPIRRIAEQVREANRRRSEDEHVLLCVDGVHGFGNQSATLDELGCDFLAAGCHKWLFGPRGTGIVAGRETAWRRTTPAIPSFLDNGVFSAWISEREPRGATNGARMSPGGFKAFEHRWALPEAFALHQAIGKQSVERRTHELTAQLKEGLRELTGVTVATPMSDELSAGIVSFDVEGETPTGVVEQLRERGVVASVAPYPRPWVRLTPSIRNTPREIDVALREVRAIAGGAGMAVASLR